MEFYLISLRVYVLGSILVEYTIPTTPTIDLDERKYYVNNTNYKNSILFGLNQCELVKVMHCQLAK